MAIGVLTTLNTDCAYIDKPMAFVENLILCKVKVYFKQQYFLMVDLKDNTNSTTWTIGGFIRL